MSDPHHAPAAETAHTSQRKDAFLNPARRKAFMVWGSVAGVICVIGGLLYWNDQRKYVFTDHAEISAPLIALAPQIGGELKRVSVHQGETVAPYQAVARVGDEIITTQVAGIVTDVQRDIGAVYRSGQAVVTMIEPQELRLIAHVEEDKGLNDVREGQKVIFTVDAFGSQKFEGTVESLSRTKKAGDVVFNISDKREAQEFDVRIQFDHLRYARFQNGMSARAWIVK